MVYKRRNGRKLTIQTEVLKIKEKYKILHKGVLSKYKKILIFVPSIYSIFTNGTVYNSLIIPVTRTRFVDKYVTGKMKRLC